MNKKSVSECGGNAAKLHLVILKKKRILVAILCVAICCVFALGGVGIAKASGTPAYKYTVVIDPGHGGIDGGVVGAGGDRKSTRNLAMSKELAQFLTDAGFRVVLTREDENGLYDEDDVNKKRADMEKRKDIIVKTNPDFVISIHANKFPGDSRRGAQAFFDGMSNDGKELAENIQSGLNALNSKYVGKEFSALKGDYFMLKCTRKPSVIVECGFLSNAEDEKLLSDAEYRKQLAFAIYSGIVGYCEV